MIKDSKVCKTDFETWKTLIEELKLGLAPKGSSRYGKC